MRLHRAHAEFLLTAMKYGVEGRVTGSLEEDLRILRKRSSSDGLVAMCRNALDHHHTKRIRGKQHPEDL